MRIRTALTLFALLALLVGSVKAATPRLLHQISAGTKLVPRENVLIPANTDEISIASGTCRLRVKERMPFDRVISPEHPLIVSRTARAGYSSAKRSELTTYVKFESRAIEDVLCVTDRAGREMTLDEFQRSIEREFSIEPPDHKVAVIE